MMKNKKAWLRILEAFIAIIIIITVLLMTIQKLPRQDRSEEMHTLQRQILNQIALNSSLRAEVLSNQTTDSKKFVAKILPAYLDFELKACEIEELCKIDYKDKEVYVDEVLISSTLNNYGPKKLKFFVWEK